MAAAWYRPICPKITDFYLSTLAKEALHRAAHKKKEKKKNIKKICSSANS